MNYIVYIIYSKSHDIYYKGFTTNLQKRIQDHNNNRSTFTKNKGPWELVYTESFIDKKSALQREKQLKRQNRKYLKWLLEKEN